MKKFLTLFMTVAIIFAMTACNNNETSTNENVETEKVEISNFLDEYISELPDDSSRKAFKSLWNAVEMTGNLLTRKMAGNTQKFEFDPSAEIPTEVSEKFDFNALLSNRDFKNHKDYKITIDGENVYIDFDGVRFYPSEYDITDVEKYVEKHCTEESDYVEE